MQRFTVIFSTVTLLATGAMADQHADGERLRHHDKFRTMILNKMDADDDHRVSASEFDKFHELRFVRMDVDSDGFLTEAEMKAYHRQRRDAWRVKHCSEWVAP